MRNSTRNSAINLKNAKHDRRKSDHNALDMNAFKNTNTSTKITSDSTGHTTTTGTKKKEVRILEAHLNIKIDLKK